MPQSHILLVEDEPGTRDLYAYVLREAGYTVTAVANAAEAIDSLASHQFDLLLSDYSLPDMTGVDLIEQVRDAAPRMRILLMSCHPQIEQLATNARVDGWFVKSPIIPDLLAVVQRLLTA